MAITSPVQFEQPIIEVTLKDGRVDRFFDIALLENPKTGEAEELRQIKYGAVVAIANDKFLRTHHFGNNIAIVRDNRFAIDAPAVAIPEGAVRGNVQTDYDKVRGKNEAEGAEDTIWVVEMGGRSVLDWYLAKEYVKAEAKNINIKVTIENGIVTKVEEVA